MPQKSAPPSDRFGREEIRLRHIEIHQGQSHFFSFFPSGGKTGAEREAGQARAFFSRAA
jgi:hypothetical protein